MFIGRALEIKQLQSAFDSNKAELACLYGRRRVGKSALLVSFCEKKPHFLFEALEKTSTKTQIQHFCARLYQQNKDPLLLGTEFKSWDSVFSYLTRWISEQTTKDSKKIVLVFDEFQWMASGRSSLVALVKYYWDNHWKHKNILLILCGSIASFMIEKVLKSKALYGRTSLEIHLGPLPPHEACLLFKKKRSLDEILKYLLVFGGIPKYLEEIKLNSSFDQNINRLCFSKNALMIKEFERIFYNQFRNATTYLKIVRSFKTNRHLSLDDLSKKLGFTSGGGLKTYLQHLQQADFIQSSIPIDRGLNSKIKKYQISDEFILFYLRFIEPNLRTLQNTTSTRLFETLVKPHWASWLGFAFERFCIKNCARIAKKLGIIDQVLVAAPYFGKKDQKFQIDLLFMRSDKVVTLCEIKYHDAPIGTEVIPEVKRKCDLYPLPKGYTLETALISPRGPDVSLKKAEFFHHFITLEDFFV